MRLRQETALPAPPAAQQDPQSAVMCPQAGESWQPQHIFTAAAAILLDTT